VKIFPRPAPPVPPAPLAGEAAIFCRGLSKSFGPVVALDDVSLTIEPNEFFTLLGPSGCGKTTLLRAIAGFIGLDRGSISVYGQRVERLAPHKRPVNTVFQSYAIFPHMTAAENIAFGLQMDRWPKHRIAARVAEMLDLVQLAGLGDRRPAQLSGGQQQRVAVARALAKSPRVLLLDEPLSALDQKLRVGMQSELKRLQRETGITFIFVTHDQREALTMSDRVAVMNAGSILQIGSPHDIYEKPAARFVADFIGETNFLLAQALGANRYRLSSGATLEAAEPGQEGLSVTLAIRPERARLDAAGPVTGRVQDIVYEGTDTIFRLLLPGGETIRIRQQNSDGAKPRLAIGDLAAVTLPPESIRVLTA
jgi:spermidine/putrescine transport system ATP-binding protein